jgi:hypothetical protein
VVFNTCHYSASTLISFSKYTADTIFVVAHCIGCQLWFNSRTPRFNCCIWCPWLATEDQKLNNFEDVTGLRWTTAFRRCYWRNVSLSLINVILLSYVCGWVVAFITSSCVATVPGKIVDYILD